MNYALRIIKRNRMTDLSEVYQRKTDKQHVLDNPDTYIGSVEKVDSEQWIYDNEKIVLKTIEYVPGLFKLFDEGIVNCRDHVIRMNQSNLEKKKIVSFIEIGIDEKTGIITMMNDGNGIDVAEHPEEKIWIPEMIFGHLRTSTNYNKNEKRIVGGKNGFGFKLVLIWSKWGCIETVDHYRSLKYVQEFHNNLEKIEKPVITKTNSSKPFTKISFLPDYKRLGLEGLTIDMIKLMIKRVYDIGAVTDQSQKKIKVLYNNKVIPVKNFQSYLDFYIGKKEESKRVHEMPNDRWEYAVCLSEKQEFMQISFVNGISTTKGGKHVDYILGQIVRKLCVYIEKKKKISCNPATIKEQIMLFLRCDLENPSFDSQTKDYMNTPSSKFGSTCTVSDSFVEKIAKMGVMEMACQLTETKEAGKKKKKMDGTKTRNIRGISNFVDANYAGTEKSNLCTLILAEGLSAMAGIVSGLQSEDRNIVGIYPLKGKLLNVRGLSRDITENKELGDLIKILGLQIGVKYNSMEEIHKNLRYSKVMIMSDQDLDGSHIKGLCINLFHAMWPSLVSIDGFLSFMNTPILRATKGNQTLRFYNDGEYNNWKNEIKDTKGWNMKYFKGLGTSTSKEFKEYFADKKIIDFKYNGSSSDDIVDMVFNKKRAENRKEWLEKYKKESYLDTTQSKIPYEKFFHDEMVHFSVYDCERSIPNVIDGLKTSLRKILYCAFKRRLTSEIKVAQFSGYVSEKSAYHHGEASLNGAIINMAQDYVGSNNINILVPNGQFGTRLKGGEDSASERYIYTHLNPIIRYVFNELDDPILHYLNDDGQVVEPSFYVPIIPFVLVNGISGIGTGFSCNIPSYNPLDLILYIRSKLKGEMFQEEFIPYFEGFTGTVKKIDSLKFLIKGKYEKKDKDRIVITELPIGSWTMNYLSFLDSLMENDKKKKTVIIKDYLNMSTEIKVNITIHFEKGKVDQLENDIDSNGINGIEKLLKLYTTISTSNMNMFNEHKQLHKFSSVEEIIDSFYCVRMKYYEKRKERQLYLLNNILQELTNKAKFILEVVENSIDLRKYEDESELDNILISKSYDKIEDKYDYLTHMRLNTMTKSNVKRILEEKQKIIHEYDKIKNTSISSMWINDLNNLEIEYKKYKQKRAEKMSVTLEKKIQKKKR